MNPIVSAFTALATGFGVAVLVGLSLYFLMKITVSYVELVEKNTHLNEGQALLAPFVTVFLIICAYFVGLIVMESIFGIDTWLRSAQNVK